MTSQKDQIQALIDEIDQVLQKAIARLPWVANDQIAEQRQTLQRMRQYLVAQQKTLADCSDQTNRNLDQAETDPQQILQLVMQEMKELRTGLLQPLQSEVAVLTQQRNALMREVRRLESHRQSYLAEQSLSQTQPSTNAAQNVEQLQKVHDRADQVLSTLDTTLKVVFDSLQKDIQVYQRSLSQGLDNLHGLGQQSEAMFALLVNRLAELLGREASSYLQSQSFQAFTNPGLSTQPPISQSQISEGEVTESKAVEAKISLPYPGTEMPATRLQTSALPDSALTNPKAAEDSFDAEASTFTELLGQLTETNQSPKVVSILPPALNLKVNTDSAVPDGRSRLHSSDASEPIISTLAEATYNPEENLLPTELTPKNPEDLKLDSATLNQLSEDLFRLEKSVLSPSVAALDRSDSEVGLIFGLEAENLPTKGSSEVEK